MSVVIIAIYSTLGLIYLDKGPQRSNKNILSSQVGPASTPSPVKESPLEYGKKYQLLPDGRIVDYEAGYKETALIYSTPNPNPMVYCNVHPNCGGGTKLLKQNECSSSTCCGFSDGRWIFYKDKTQCSEDQQNSQPNNKTTTNLGSLKIHCSYNGGSEYYFDYGELTWDECTAKSKAYWASKKVVIPTYTFQPVILPTQSSSTTTTTRTVDEAACRRQYQAETQAANSLGGSARDAAIEIATQSLNRCLSSGVVEVHTIQKEPTPTVFDSGCYGGCYGNWSYK